MIQQKKSLIVVGGPTASGKTDFALQLAHHFDTVIISADSRQFYRQMNIGTAKPTAAQLRQIPHHFINFLDIDTPYSVGDFEQDALALTQQLWQQHERVIVVGGSNLYIKALCEGLDKFPEVPPAIRQEVQAQYEREGLAPLQSALQECDPVYFQEVDLNNPHRLIRALSVYRASGQPFSSFRQQQPTIRPFTPIYLRMEVDRPVLYERINRRVDQMLTAGLVAEARQLYPYRHHTALQTVGYQELFGYFADEYDLEEAVRLIKRNTRRYAKRQLTWLRKEQHWYPVSPDALATAIEYIEAQHRLPSK